MILGRGEETKFLNACELVGGSQLRCLKVSEKGRRRRKVCGIPVVTVAWTVEVYIRLCNLQLHCILISAFLLAVEGAKAQSIS